MSDNKKNNPEYTIILEKQRKNIKINPKLLSSKGGKEKTKQYYEKNKENLQRIARDRYREASDEKKDKKGGYGKDRYKYEKNYCDVRKIDLKQPHSKVKDKTKIDF